MSVLSSQNPFFLGHLPMFQQIDVEKYGFNTIRMQIDNQKKKYIDFENNLNKN